MTLSLMGAEPEPGAPPVTKPPSSTPRKICVVCGDRALGYNFNVISCESCKAFFRRNALAGKEFKCPFANACEITAVTRRFCQRCRLEKCFSVGMIKEFIMSEEDKARKREKIEENRAKKRGVHEDAVSSSRDEGSSEVKNARLVEGVQCQVLSTTSGADAYPYASYADSYTSYGYSVSAPLPPPPPPPILDDKASVLHRVEKQATLPNTIRSILTKEEGVAPSKAEWIAVDVLGMESTSMESILCEAIRLEFEAQTPLASAGVTGGGGGGGSGSSRALNDAERAKLEELVVANKALHAPLDEDVSQLAAAAPAPPGTHDPELINIVNLTAVAIRRLIKMAKKISAFRNLCEADQVALLKGGCIEMMVLRSTMNYDGQKNSWRLPYTDERFGTVPADVLKKAKGNIYQAHDRFIRSFEPRWRHDERLVLLLSAISLFSPERARVVHADVVRLEQHAYYYLLRRYLESVYAGCEAKATFLRLIGKVRELRRLAEEVTGVYLDVNPLEPLLIEIFDLKHGAAPL